MKLQNLKNSDLVLILFQSLKSMGVCDLIICAGARNIPIIAALDHFAEGPTNFHVESYFEERSAGFYALGKIKSTNQAVAVVTTSGTAVAELLPAAIEAYYQNLPLIIVSADRPKSYRGTGAPQSIEQVGIFSSYVESVYDWDINSTEFKINYSGSKPIHINMCFDEPLIDGELFKIQDNSLFSCLFSNDHFKNKFQKTNLKINQTTSSEKIEVQNPIAVISELKISDREFVKNFLIQNQIIHYAEFLSGLKNVPELLSLQVQSSDIFIKNIFLNRMADSVLRIGGIPTLRFWRDLEFDFKNIPVYSFSDTEFSGLSRKNQLFDLTELMSLKIQQDKKINFKLDNELQSKKINLLSEFKNSEPNMVFILSEVISSKPLYMGNSLPIRMWDMLSQQSQQFQSVCANRGANGIDGQISTYLGWAQNKSESWCVVGDLTALYDMAALGLVAESKNKYRIVIINNSGGQIFNRLFGNKKYLNAQDIHFKSWASMWSWDHILVNDSKDFLKLSSEIVLKDRVIIEIKTDNRQTELFWQQWDLICKN